MRVSFILIAILMLSFIACSDEEAELASSSQTPAATFVSDPSELAQSSLRGMDALKSYRMEITFRPEGQPFTTTVEYSDPGDYRYVIHGFNGNDSATEAIQVGNAGFVRFCERYPDDCESWERHEITGLSGLGGFTTTIPETLPFVAIDLAEDLQVYQDEEDVGSEFVRLRAEYNLLRSIRENQRRVVAAAGIDEAYGEECTTSVGSNQTPTSTCRPVSSDEEYAEERAEYGENFEKAPLGPLEILIHPGSGLLDSVFLGTPGSSDPTQDVYLEVHYSGFNEVIITTPE